MHSIFVLMYTYVYTSPTVAYIFYVLFNQCSLQHKLHRRVHHMTYTACIASFTGILKFCITSIKPRPYPPLVQYLQQLKNKHSTKILTIILGHNTSELSVVSIMFLCYSLLLGRQKMGKNRGRNRCGCKREGERNL